MAGDWADLRTVGADLDLPEPAGALPVPAEASRPAPRTTVVPDERKASTTPAPSVSILEMSPDCAELFAALAAAQGEFGDVDRTLEARIQSQRTGGAYTYAYESLADVLAAVRPALSKHGLAVLQLPFTRAASVVVRTMLVYGKAGGRGQWLYNELIASVPDTAPQSIGSGITFLRRYALKSILGLSAGFEDDDGQAASPRAPIHAAARKSEASRPTPAPTPPPKPRPDPPMPAPIPTPPVPSTPPPAAAPTPNTVGTIAEVRDVDGGALIKLSTGLVAGTRNAEIIAAAKEFLEAKDVVVELTTRPASDPSRAPSVLELRPAIEDEP